jgi:hypothetical protein
LKQYTWIENTSRIYDLLGGSQHLANEWIDFTIITTAVVAPYCMMMRYGASARNHCFVCCAFNIAPRCQCTGDASIRGTRSESEVRRNAVRVRVSHPARQQDIVSSGLLDCRGNVSPDVIVETLEPIPGDGGLEGIQNYALPYQWIAPVRHAQKRITPGPCCPAAVFTVVL